MKYQLSIIIPTKDRATNLKQCLLSIEKQNCNKNDFEVIVIDNGSTDSTKEVACSFSSKLNLTYCYAPNPGLHTGRNKGIQLAQSSIVTYVDDDIIAFPNWLKSIINSFKDPKIAMVGGNNIPKYETSTPSWLNQWWSEKNTYGNILPLLSTLDFGEGEFLIDPDYIWGCNFSIRKQLLIQANGFHPDALPANMLKFRGDGETHISNYIKKHNLKALFNSNASVYHCVPKERVSVDYFEQKSFAQGISNSYTSIRNKKERPSFTNLFKLQLLLIIKITKCHLVTSKYKELYLIKLKTQISYLKGYLFHQRKCKKDKTLLEWVLKDNYFE